jgi:hypothetical protein
LFRANGVPVEKIFVRQTGSTCESFIFIWVHINLFIMPVLCYYCSTIPATLYIFQTLFTSWHQAILFNWVVQLCWILNYALIHCTRSPWQEDDEGFCQAWTAVLEGRLTSSYSASYQLLWLV